MEISPFPYQGPLRPDEVTGRDELLIDLANRLDEHRVTALVSPRQFGKTSVLRHFAAERTGTATVWVDLYEVTSMADVVVRFDNALGSTSGAFAEAVRTKAAGSALSLGTLGAELAGPARSRPDPSLVLYALLDVLVTSATTGPALLVIDDFSSISRVPAAAGALRTALQRQRGDLGVVLAGSHPGAMRRLFGDPSAAFYGQGDLVEVDPLSLPAIQQLVVRGFSSTGRQAGHVANRIAAFAGRHPQRTMQVADACWRQTPTGGTADADRWAKALQETRRATDAGMERIYSGFERGERDVLRAVARSGTVYGAEARLLGLPRGTATHARDSLIDSGELLARAGHLTVVDPLFADWIRRRFPL